MGRRIMGQVLTVDFAEESFTTPLDYADFAASFLTNMQNDFVNMFTSTDYFAVEGYFAQLC